MKYDPPTPSARNEVKTRTSTSIRGELEPNPPSPLRRGQSGRLINNSPSSSSHATSTGGCSNATPPNSSASIDRQGSSVVRGSEGQTCSESTNKSVDSKSETSHELLKSSTKTSPCQVQTNQGRRRESAKSRLGEGKLGSDEPRRGSLSGSVRKTTLSQNGKDLTIYSNSSVNGQGEMRQREPGVSSTQRPHKSDARLKHTQSETLLPKRLSTTSEKRRSSGIGSNVVPSRPVNVRNPNPSKGLGDIGRKSSPAPRHINSNTSSKKMSSNGSSSSEPLSLAERSRNISHDSNKTNLGATKKGESERWLEYPLLYRDRWSLVGRP